MRFLIKILIALPLVLFAGQAYAQCSTSNLGACPAAPFNSIASNTLTLNTPLAIANGGTGGNNAAAALAALGAAPSVSATFTGVTNFTGPVQYNGNTITFPSSAATLLTQSGAYNIGDCPVITSTTGAIGDFGSPCGSGGGGSAAGSLTGTTLAANVVNSSLTTLAGGAVGTAAFLSTGSSGNTIPTNSGGFTQSGTVNFTGTFNVAGNTMTWPNAGGTVTLLAASQTLLNKTINASANTLSNIPNSALVSASTTVNGQTCTLGSTCTVTASAGTLTAGSTALVSCAASALLYNNAAVLGCESPSTLTFAGSQITSGTVIASFLPTASLSALGVMQVGSGLSVSGAGLVSLTSNATTVNGVSCALGSTCAITAATTSLTVGTTAISGGSTGNILYNNAGVLGAEAASALTFAGSQITSGTVAATYLPTATGSSLGLMEVGSGLSVSAGLVSLTSNSAIVNGVTCTLGSNCTITASAGTLTAGSTALVSCTASALLYNNANVLGCEAPSALSIATSQLTGSSLPANILTSSLTGVGTIGTGVWQGTVVGATYGGTGINNGSKTITLGGSLTTTGSAAPTLAFGSSSFTYTYPNATSTLAALGVAQSWTAAQTFANANLLIAGSTSGAMTLEAPAIAAGYIITFPAATDTVDVVGTAQSISGVKTFNNSAIVLLGSSTGGTTFSSANGSATNYTLTFPAATATLATTANINTALPSATTSQLYVGTSAAGAAAAASVLPTAAMPALTGDLTGTAASLSVNVTGLSHVTNGSLPSTGLAASGVSAGTYGSASVIPAFTVNAQGQITATSTATVTAPSGTLTGSTLASNVTASSLTSFGTSPALTGTPTAPTAAVGTNTTQIATTAFVLANGGTGGGGTVGNATVNIVTASGNVTPTTTQRTVVLRMVTPGAYTVTLPAKSNFPNCPASIGSCPTYTVIDGAGVAATYPNTVATADGTPINGATTCQQNTNYQTTQFVLDGNTWDIVQ